MVRQPAVPRGMAPILRMRLHFIIGVQFVSFGHAPEHPQPRVRPGSEACFFGL